MRSLTKKDTPFLCKMLEEWAADLPFPLDRTQLITWAEQYPDEVIAKGVSVTAGWYQRQTARRPDTAPPSEQDAYRYASACMRNVDRARSTAEQLLGGAQ